MKPKKDRSGKRLLPRSSRGSRVGARMTNKPFSMHRRANIRSNRYEYMENGTNALKGALNDRKGKERKIEMEAKQRLEQIKNEIKKMKGILSEEREYMEEVNQEIYDAEVKQRELKEQIDTTEFLLEKLTRDQWELEKEIEEAKKPKTIWDLENCDEHYWVLGTGEVMRDFWFGGVDQVKRRDIGNVFLTEQEAGDEARARKLIAKAKHSEGNRGFVLDGKNKFVYYDYSYRDVFYGVRLVINFNPALGYWEKEEDVKNFIDENREELKWYFTEYCSENSED